MYLEEMPNLNRLPAELLENVPRLEPGQIAVFRSLKTSIHYDLEKDRQSVVYNRLFVTYKDEIRYKGKVYHIGIPKDFRDGKVESFLSEVFGSQTLFTGKIVLHGDSALDQKKYEFLMLSNYRKNPGIEGLVHDSRVTPKLEFVDDQAEGKERRKKRSILKQALDVAESLDIRQVKDFVASLNMNENQDNDVLRDIVESYAEKNAVVFLDAYKDKNFLKRATVRRASDAGIIFFDTHANKVRWVDSKNTAIATLEPEAKDDWVKGFAEYCGSNSLGDKAFKEISRRISEKIVSGKDTDDAGKSSTPAPVSEGVGVQTGAPSSFDNL